jgi:hypothetical protein
MNLLSGFEDVGRVDESGQQAVLRAGPDDICALFLCGKNISLRGLRIVSSSRGSGKAVRVKEGSVVEVHDCQLECEAVTTDTGAFPSDPAAALFVRGAGAQVQVTRCVVHAPGEGARGVVAGPGASVSIADTRVARCSSAGVWATGAGTLVAMRGCMVEETSGLAGLCVCRGARVEAQGCVFRRNMEGHGVSCTHEGSRLELTGCVVEEAAWAGVSLRWGANAKLVSNVIRDNPFGPWAIKGHGTGDVVQLGNVALKPGETVTSAQLATQKIALPSLRLAKSTMPVRPTEPAVRLQMHLVLDSPTLDPSESPRRVKVMKGEVPKKGRPPPLPSAKVLPRDIDALLNPKQSTRKKEGRPAARSAGGFGGDENSDDDDDDDDDEASKTIVEVTKSPGGTVFLTRSNSKQSLPISLSSSSPAIGQKGKQPASPSASALSSTAPKLSSKLK